MNSSVRGIDVGNNGWSLAGLDASGGVVLRRRVKRETVIGLAAKRPSCIAAMAAGCGAHHRGRIFAAHGHAARLMPPADVRPSVKAQKNDDRDAASFAEAAPRPTRRFVESKSPAQRDRQTRHRSRDRLVAERTAPVNQLRASLVARGIVVPNGNRSREHHLAALPEGEGGKSLGPRMPLLIEAMRA